MQKFKIYIILVLFLGSVYPAMAQDDSMVFAKRDTTTKRPLLLSFGLDLNLTNIAGYYNHDYTGEYNVNGGGPDGWRWVRHQSTYDKVMETGKFTNVKLHVLIANTKIFQMGLSYNFGFLEDSIPETNFDSTTHNAHPTINVQHSSLYAGISLMSEYNYYFNRKTYMGPYVYGALDLGFYTGSDDLFGPGIPFYIQGRAGIGYDFKHDIMIKAFISSDHLIYRETSTSQIFQRQQSLNIDFNALYFGIGISKTFTIIPD